MWGKVPGLARGIAVDITGSLWIVTEAFKIANLKGTMWFETIGKVVYSSIASGHDGSLYALD